MRLVALAIVLLSLAGCVTDSANPNTSSSRRGDPDAPKQDCEHTEIAGASRTVCY